MLVDSSHDSQMYNVLVLIYITFARAIFVKLYKIILSYQCFGSVLLLLRVHSVGPQSMLPWHRLRPPQTHTPHCAHRTGHGGRGRWEGTGRPLRLASTEMLGEMGERLMRKDEWRESIIIWTLATGDIIEGVKSDMNLSYWCIDFLNSLSRHIWLFHILRFQFVQVGLPWLQILINGPQLHHSGKDLLFTHLNQYCAETTVQALLNLLATPVQTYQLAPYRQTRRSSCHSVFPCQCCRWVAVERCSRWRRNWRQMSGGTCS